MGIELMGNVHVSARIENLADSFVANRGLLPADQVRFVEFDDALVDTGATQLSMPRRLIQQLGLSATRQRQARTDTGIVSVQVYEAVRLIVQGRDCLSDVSELPDECPVLIGQLPLESMDLAVDLRGQKLIGNPAHGGEQMIEMY